jgi:tetratricopeptide (TPR) repeat protein
MNFASSLHIPYLNDDFSQGLHRYTMEDVSKVNFNFPNISGTTQPVKMYVGRYYKNIDSIQIAKRLFIEAIQDNPYIKSPQAQLAYLYFDEEQYDSAYYYAKDAFYFITDNNVHRDIYFKTLAQRKDTIELQNAFKILKNTQGGQDNPNHWLGYFDAKIQIVEKNNPEVLKLIDEFEMRFPNYDKEKLEGIKTVAKSDLQGLAFGQAFANMASEFFEEENYEEASIHYEFALQYADQEYPYFENAAISYYLNNEYSNALKYFDIVINKFKSKDGKSEFYKGIMLIELDSIDKGCDMLKVAASKKYSGESSLNVYQNFCN